MTIDQEFFGEGFEDIGSRYQKELDAKKAERERVQEAERQRVKAAKEEQQRREERLKAYRVRIAQDHPVFAARIAEETDEGVLHALESLLGLEDFNNIVVNCNSIPDTVRKMEYVGRIMYERVYQPPFDEAQKREDVEAIAALRFPVFTCPAKTVRFYHQLRLLGMPVLCPYLILDGANKTTHENCYIDGRDKQTAASCGGRFDICQIFKDRTRRAAFGQCSLPVIDYPQPEIPDECAVDLEDLRDWWRQEGTYS